MNHETTIATLNAQLDNCAKDLYEKDKRIAELEAQLAAAPSAPAVERKNQITHVIVDHPNGGDLVAKLRTPLYTAPIAADTDKVREASAWEALRADVLHGVDGLDNDQVNTVLGMIDHCMPTADMAAQAPVREVPGWQPIETAPKDGTDILAVMQGFTPCVVCWREGYWMTADMEDQYEDGEFDHSTVWQLTHWMPLPAAPVQQEGEKP